MSLTATTAGSQKRILQASASTRSAVSPSNGKIGHLEDVDSPVEPIQEDVNLAALALD